MKRRRVFAVFGSGIGISRQKLLHAFSAATRGGPVQGSVAVLIGEVRVSLGEKKKIDDVGVAFDCCPVQRRVAIAIDLSKFELH